MGNSDLTRILAELVKEQALTRPANTKQVIGLSNAILSSVGPQKPYDSGTVNQTDIRGPSFMNRILDLMSRPLYASIGAVKGSLERTKADAAAGASLPELALNSARMLSPLTNPQELNDIWSGLSGEKKQTGKDLVQFGEDTTGQTLPGPAKAALSFGVDIAADPLTYVGGIGLLPKLGKGAKTSTEALKAIEEGTGKTAQNISEQIARQATDQADKLRTEIPTKNLVAPAPGSPSRLFVAGPGPGPDTTSFLEKQYQNGNLIRGTLDEVMAIAKQRAKTPIAAIEAGPSVKIRSPIDILKETLAGSKTGRTELGKLIEKMPSNADPMAAIKILHDQVNAAKSPIAKNLLKKQIDKLQAGVKPADILSEARVAPPAFPEVSIGERWINEAKRAAEVFLENNKTSNINHIGQSKLYDKILHYASKVRKDRRSFTVLQMLRVAEDTVLGAGRHLTDAEGISVRLSDVANLAGGPRSLNSKLVDSFRKARPSQQVEDLKAFTAPQTASQILDPVIKTSEKIVSDTADLPPSRTVMMGSPISRELAKLAEAAGASSREAKTAKKFIDDLFNPTLDKLHSAIHQEARNLVRQTSSGIINPSTLSKISEDTYKVLEANPKVLGRQVYQSKVVEGIMTKFATWWGAKDLQPFSREYIDTARNVAAAFSETITPIVRATTATQRATAWSVATGKLSAGSAEEVALGNQFRYIVERLLGAHGVKENAEAVIYRSGTLLNELNAELPNALKLMDHKGVDVLGREFDYTDGKWMNSWKEWTPKEPAEALYQLTRSLQLVTRKNAMWDDAAVRWGMPMKGAEFQHIAQGVPRLAGTYFPEQIAKQLTALQGHFERDVFKTPHKSIELFDKVQRMWKTGVTIYSPSHHIRNLNGDIYLASLDGVVSPRPYSIATKVLHAFPTRYKDMESVFSIMDPHLRDIALRARPGNVVLTTKRGDRLTSEQIYQAAESQGLFPRAAQIEDLAGGSSPAFGTLGPKIQPFGGRVNQAASTVAELREHWVRLAHFVDVLGKSNQPLKTAIEQAALRVKKFHPDGMDMTGFEQNVMRRVIPFYSWMRKATPLVIEGALMRPHITMLFPKAMADMQLATGIESQGPGDPFPLDQMFPDWLKEKGIGPILQPGSGLGRQDNWRGHSPGYTIINPSTPFLDQGAQLGSPVKTLLSALTPTARIPIELLTGQTTLGIPLQNVQGGVPGYLAQQVPAVGIGMRLTGATRNNEPFNPEQLLNWGTGAGITGTGPYQAQSQTEIRQLLAKMAGQNRGDYR